ncbi:MAG: MoaD/ThiS family protein [Saprospiraceae bacterium]|nr:MoaD/ThiS family protein [Saprospiraceae bacterium]
MPTVKFTYALRRFFPSLKDTEVSSESLPDLLQSIDAHYPGIRTYVVDERGALRKHVLIFIDGEVINDRSTLSDQFSENSEIHIMQSLSGG